MDMDAANSNEDDDNSPLMVDGEGNGQSSWHPRFEAFSAYSPQGSTSTATSTKSSALRIVTRRPLVARLTKDIVDTYWACNPKFSYKEASKPKRFLTNPSNGVLNDGHDNANSDLILSVNFVLVNETQQRYIVKDMLGQGTFGQVAKCWISETNSYVAVKVIKNLPAYYHQALVEVSILTMLNQRFDPEDKHHMVRILDYFVFQQHLCISFEMLGSNLYELIKMNQFRGLSLSIVQMFSKQILHALVIMKDAGIIHCDLKPENILLSTNVKPPEIKIIDFGSACTENRTIYSYIQSRYYRSPEVLLGHPYTTAIDMWSFGCIIAELFLGWPLFPGASEFDLIKRMIEILGTQPPDHMLKASKSTSKFFKCVGGLHCVEDKEIIDRTKTPYQLLTESPYQLLTEDEYEVRELKKPVLGKQYFNYVRLEDIVVNYPYRKNLTQEEINKESLTRLALIDFLRGVIEFDPVKRWSPSQAAGHPFLTGEPYLCSYVPPSETPQITVAQNVVVDHNPGGGHWFQAGLSPQISDGNRYLIPNGLYFPMAPFSLVSSYGSYGSHGSYKDCNLGSSHGSYGDGMYNNFCSIVPSGLNILQAHIGSSFGANPVTRHRASQLPHGPTYGGSSVGKFGAMSLGATPSQFTPPSSQLQISSGSPGKYGSTSPARNNLHGSPLSKVSAFGHYNQKRSWGSSNASHMQPNENVNSQNRHGSYTDGSGFNHPENNYFGHGSPHNFQLASSVPGWTQGCGNYAPGLSSLTIHQNYPGAAPFTSHLPASSTTEAFLENIECTSQPNPGDWDPNYSDDLLLQDDDPDTAALSSGIFNGLHVSKASDSTIVTENITDRRIFNASNQIQRFCGNNSSNRRTNTFQTYCHGERISPPINDKHNAQNILKHPHHMPHYLQSSPSRFSQQPFQQMSYTQGALTTSYCDQMNKLPFASHCNTQGLHSPRINMFANGVSCGHRTNHHSTSSLPPSSHSRKDYERIA